MTRRYLLLLSILAGCEKASEPTFPLTDGTSVPVPLACRAEPAGTAPYSATFELRNTGTRPVFLAVDYNCAPRAAVSSCARDFKDDLLGHGASLCPCEGSCPVGGAGCSPAGKLMAPGARESFSWSAIIGVQGMRNGESCAAGTRNLPAGRYRVTAPAFATDADAAAGQPILFTISQDFELRAPTATVDVPFAVP
jgi:hypothetical protein